MEVEEMEEEEEWEGGPDSSICGCARPRCHQAVLCCAMPGPGWVC